MGEMADFAFDQAMTEWENFHNIDINDFESLYDQGFCDEKGDLFGNPFVNPPIYKFGLPIRKSFKKHLVKVCPLCGADTELKVGQYGNFYGCLEYPKCNGSRKYLK